eukprot:CAMPEP_0168411054 /NCGR_PEP_ID=MMETSP0228-20121227/28007_1 /TAXON_ID=133427 /ORGANISM="Protoceratium reticulatum, Strain CCCM 535 (=CCMP 1889)" /LENGTH=351 /DNA_ID=CAMNT_0008424797 /DNA_START=182 /DNA_END=1234 /DNA_ORIENTATION=-
MPRGSFGLGRVSSGQLVQALPHRGDVRAPRVLPAAAEEPGHGPARGALAAVRGAAAPGRGGPAAARSQAPAVPGGPKVGQGEAGEAAPADAGPGRQPGGAQPQVHILNVEALGVLGEDRALRAVLVDRLLALGGAPDQVLVLLEQLLLAGPCLLHLALHARHGLGQRGPPLLLRLADGRDLVAATLASSARRLGPGVGRLGRLGLLQELAPLGPGLGVLPALLQGLGVGPPLALQPGAQLLDQQQQKLDDHEAILAALRPVHSEAQPCLQHEVVKATEEPAVRVVYVRAPEGRGQAQQRAGGRVGARLRHDEAVEGRQHARELRQGPRLRPQGAAQLEGRAGALVQAEALK